MWLTAESPTCFSFSSHNKQRVPKPSLNPRSLETKAFPSFPDSYRLCHELSRAGIDTLSLVTYMTYIEGRGGSRRVYQEVWGKIGRGTRVGAWLPPVLLNPPILVFNSARRERGNVPSHFVELLGGLKVEKT